MNYKGHKVYTTIHSLPYWNFDKARNSGDLRYLFKVEDYDELEQIPETEDQFLIQVWERLFDEYLDHFGIPKQLEKIVQIKKEIAILEAELVLYQKAVNKTFIEVKKKQLEKLNGNEGNGKSVKFEEQVVSLERWLKIRIDERKITTVKFLTYLQEYTEEANRANLQNLKHGKN